MANGQQVTIEQAIQIVRERLGRGLTPQEMIDLRTVVAAGITDSQLANETINSDDPEKTLFPDFGVPGEQFAEAQAAKLQVSAQQAASTAPAGFDPSAPFNPAALTGAGFQPNLGYDPFSLGDFGTTTFIAAEDEVSRVQGQPLGAEPDVLGVGTTIERETVPVEAQVAKFYSELVNWSEDRVKNFQRSLIKAGYLGEGDFRLGFADEQTLKAAGFAIVDAQRRGIPLPDSLQQAAEAFKLTEKRAERRGARAEAESKAERVRDMELDRYRSQLTSSYLSNWGVAPPPGYIQRIMDSGMNFYEFNAHERAKPGFRNSPRYQMERISAEAELARTFGAL